MKPLSPKRVFISFKTEEKHHALIFRKALEEVGYLVWLQVDLQCGHEWHGEIDKALNEAGAIVVLWSPASHNSQWVRHEASQAMAMDRYAPVRIEEVKIDNPYSRRQAVDINDWNGEINHLGFQNLLTRLKELMPPPVPLLDKWAQEIWKQRLAILFLSITIAALLLLLKQRNILNKQISEQAEIGANVRKTEGLLNATKDSLDNQFVRVNDLNKQISGNINLALMSLDSQRKRSQLLSSDMSNSLIAQRKLLTEQKNSSLQALKAYYPLEPLSIFYEKEYSMDQKGLEEYMERIKKLVLNELDKKSNKPGLKLNNIIIRAIDTSWFPSKDENEATARRFLSYDYATNFIFKSDKGNELIFISYQDETVKNLFIGKSSVHKLNQNVQLSFDFPRKIIIQRIQCENPVRGDDDDITAISAIDLINRDLSWEYDNITGIKSRISRIGIKLSNDFDYRQGFHRFFNIPENATSIKITPSHLGLEKLF